MEASLAEEMKNGRCHTEERCRIRRSRQLQTPQPLALRTGHQTYARAMIVDCIWNRWAEGAASHPSDPRWSPRAGPPSRRLGAIADQVARALAQPRMSRMDASEVGLPDRQDRLRP